MERSKDSMHTRGEPNKKSKKHSDGGVRRWLRTRHRIKKIARGNR